jgi:hypothetical protein
MQTSRLAGVGSEPTGKLASVFFYFQHLTFFWACTTQAAILQETRLDIPLDCPFRLIFQPYGQIDFSH